MKRVCLLPIVIGLVAAPSSAPATSYSTTFPLTENPISEGGHWINGGVVGLDWTNVQTLSGRAVGTLSTVGYSDPTAVVTGSWGPDQTIVATVYSKNPTSSYYQEVELRLRTTVKAHSITGYEVFFRCLKTSAAYAQIVRWNGPLGDFSYLASKSGAQYGVADGDVVKATIVGNVIKGYINGVEVISATDSTFSSGNPGMGFNYGVGSTYADFGFTDWLATDSVAPPDAGAPPDKPKAQDQPKPLPDQTKLTDKPKPLPDSAVKKDSVSSKDVASPPPDHTVVVTENGTIVIDLPPPSDVITADAVPPSERGSRLQGGCGCVVAVVQPPSATLTLLGVLVLALRRATGVKRR